MTHARTFRLSAAGAAVVCAAGAVLAPASGAITAPITKSTPSNAGLFGTQDPTFDGVYRQGLAMTGLTAVNQRVPKAALTWLLHQQCGNGSFTSYRANVSAKCAAPDPQAYTGQDTNATAMAAMALNAVDQPAPAKSALRYLRDQQNADGGFPWFRGGASDTNSTGLILATMKGFDLGKSARKQVDRAERYLRKAQLQCDVPVRQRGMLQFQLGLGTPDALGTAQGLVGTMTTLPASPLALTGRKLTCKDGAVVGRPDVAATTLYALTGELKRNGGLLPSSFGPGPDVSASATAATALAASDWKPGVLRTTVKALKRATGEYVLTDGSTNAGATGTLLLAAGMTGANPKSFGGVNLVKTLKGSRQ